MGWHVSGQLKPQQLGPGASLEVVLVTQFVARGGSVEGGSIKNTTASRMPSGSHGRACLPANSRVAGFSGSIRVAPVQPKRLSRVGLCGCPRFVLSCASCRLRRSVSIHRDTATDAYALTAAKIDNKYIKYIS